MHYLAYLIVAIVFLIGGFALYKHRAALKAAAIAETKASLNAVEKKL